MFCTIFEVLTLMKYMKVNNGILELFSESIGQGILTETLLYHWY